MATPTPWDERYAGDEHLFGTEPNDFLAETAHLLPPGPVLCIGDGEGRNGVHLAVAGHEVTSVDQSAVGLAKAERLAAARGTSIATVVADLADYDLGRSRWSAIVSIFCHLPSALRRQLYPRFASALVPGGVLVLEAYTPDQIGRGTGGPPVADPLLTAAELRELLSGLVIDRCEELERDVVEGSGHTGRAAVVQVIAHRRD